MKNKYKLLLLMSGLIICFFSGCSQTSSLDERLIIKGIAVDAAEEGYHLCVQALKTGKSLDSKEGGEKKISMARAKGGSVLEAMSRIKEKTGKEPLYAQNLILVISEELAKENMCQVMDFFVRYHETRPSVKVLISRGKASDIMALEIDGQEVIIEEISSMVQKSHGGNIKSTVQSLGSQLSNKYDSARVIAVRVEEEAGEKTLKCDSLAVFEGGKIAYFLSEEDIAAFLIVNGKAKNLTNMVNVPEIGKITYIIGKSGSSVEVETDGQLKFLISIDLSVDVWETNTANDINCKLVGFSQRVESALNEKFIKLCSDILSKTVVRYETDIFNLNRYLINARPWYFREVESNLKHELINATYEVKVNTRVNSIGQGASFL